MEGAPLNSTGASGLLRAASDRHLDIDLNMIPVSDDDEPESSKPCRSCKGKQPNGTASDPLLIDSEDDVDNTFCRCKQLAVQNEALRVVIRENRHAGIPAENPGRRRLTIRGGFPSPRRRLPRGAVTVAESSQQTNQSSNVNPHLTTVINGRTRKLRFKDTLAMFSPNS